MLVRDQLPVDLARSVTFSLVHSCIFASVIKNGVKCFLNLYPYSMDLFSYNCRACVSLGALGISGTRGISGAHIPTHRF